MVGVNMQVLSIVAVLLLQVFCVVHALKRGYPYHFVTIILLFPLIGPLAYLIIEMGPTLYYRHLRHFINHIRPKEDPYQQLVRLQQDVQRHPTIDNQHRLAEIYMQLGQFNEALYLLNNLLQRQFATDPYLLLDKAKALFALGEYQKAKSILEFLANENSGFQSPQGHLLFARTLSALGQTQCASREFERLESHFHGLESSYYFLQHLRKHNNYSRAQEILKNMRNRLHRLPSHYRNAEKSWLKQAEQER